MRDKREASVAPPPWKDRSDLESLVRVGMESFDPHVRAFAAQVGRECGYDFIPASVAEQPTPQRLRDLIPAHIWARYDESVDAAHSVGAMKQLRNMQREIGERFIELALKSGAGR